MSSIHICDRRDCPAPAQHDVDIHGQDFHFCSHHWAEIAPALVAHLDAWSPRAGGVPAGRGAGTRSAAGLGQPSG